MRAFHQIFTTSFILVFSASAQAQSLERDVISTSGEYFQNANFQVAYTLGEVMAETFSVAQTQLDQGFQQALADVINITENEDPATPILFPNPFVDKISIEQIPSGTTSIVLLQPDGKVLKYTRILSQQSIQFTWSDLPKGSYLLQINSDDHQSIYPIIKAQ